MHRVRFSNDPTTLRPEQAEGFFVGWPNPPSSETLVRILQSSFAVWLAFDDDRLVGLVNALSDGVLNAFVPLLEVLPEFQGKGIGTELVRRMSDSLGELYAIDVVCDEGLIPFYRSCGFQPLTAMAKRNYGAQAGVGHSAASRSEGRHVSDR